MIIFNTLTPGLQFAFFCHLAASLIVLRFIFNYMTIFSIYQTNLTNYIFGGYSLSDVTSKCEPPVVHAVRWDIQVWATGGTHRRMGHPSVSYRWYAPVSTC